MQFIDEMNDLQMMAWGWIYYTEIWQISKCISVRKSNT